jgi:hypothetical protein
MNKDNKLIFEAFLKSVTNKAYIFISYDDRAMSQAKITTVQAQQVPELLTFGLDKLLEGQYDEDTDESNRFEYVEVYEPDGTRTANEAIALSSTTDVVLSYTGGDDVIIVTHNLQSIYDSLIDDVGMPKENADSIMRRLIDDGAVDYFSYNEGNHFHEPEHVIFYRTSNDPKDWYRVNALSEVSQVIGKSLSNAFGSRDFEQPEDPNREDPDDNF